MVRFIFVGCVWWGCASGDDPRLERIDPSMVTSLVPTSASVIGTNLDALVSIDLDSTTAPEIDDAWRVRIDDLSIDAEWRDREHLDIVIPAGLAVGTHDVFAIAPDGRELVLPDGLTVADPTEQAQVIAVDPFGDGTRFGFVTGYRGHLVIGPNQAGSSALRCLADGSSCEPLAFAFFPDVTGNRTRNPASASLGAAGCIEATPACGPDNENGRGTLTGVTLDGVEWLVAIGAGDGLGHFYMTDDSDTTLDFRYVDLDVLLSFGNTLAGTALVATGDRMYVATADKGGRRPALYALTTMPQSPGIDATASDVLDLRTDLVPGVQSVNAFDMIDELVEVDGVLYGANRTAWFRSTVASPQSAADSPVDWAVIHPSAEAFTTTIGRVQTTARDLEPADRAVPQIASFGGRVFVARNTTVGPQLWACDAPCDSAAWYLVAPNNDGAPLTQFDDLSLHSVSMVVATPAFLYVGFDSTDGVRVFRTAKPDARTHADFEPYGSVGFGDRAAYTRILDAAVLTLDGTPRVWLTAGNGISPFSLVTLP